MSHEPRPHRTVTVIDIIARLFEALIYNGRWVIMPMYLGLLVVLVAYTYHYVVELAHLCTQLTTISEEALMLAALSLVDVTMIGNLILMIMIGSYTIFVRKLAGTGDRPLWLENITSGTLKVKMGTSLIGVSSIHLLKDFIDAEHLSPEQIIKHGALHLVFVVSTIALAYADCLMHPAGHVSSGTPAHS